MNDALQHCATAPGPHPLPLFLDLVAKAASQDPALARAALDGLRVYRAAPRQPARQQPVVDQQQRARLLGNRHGRQTVVLIPSLINGAAIFDLSAELSLIDWLNGVGYDALLLDWGTPAPEESAMSIDDHIWQLLIPLLQRLDAPVHLIGYCLGGTIAIAAASLMPVQTLTLLATPWNFARYPDDARNAMAQFWQEHRSIVQSSGAMPIAWLQHLFWGLDPQRTIAKYAALAGKSPHHFDVTRFAMVEDWANGGAPLTWGASRQLFDDMMSTDQPGRGKWSIASTLAFPDQGRTPTLQIIAADDRIVPSATKAELIGEVLIPGGHVGMIVGRHRFALRSAILQHITASQYTL